MHIFLVIIIINEGPLENVSYELILISLAVPQIFC